MGARFLFKETFEFRPSFTLWLAANRKPRVQHDDEGMWRRILQVPFEIVIPKQEQDQDLKRTLRDPGTAGAAILAWAVQGCLDWQREGLCVPLTVRDATGRYREEMNPLASFFEERCELDPEVRTESAALWKAYGEFADENRLKYRLTRRDFAKALESQGCVQNPTGKARMWKGIRLREDRFLSEGDAW